MIDVALIILMVYCYGASGTASQIDSLPPAARAFYGGISKVTGFLAVAGVYHVFVKPMMEQ
jgi:hypothetical protein